MPTEDVAFQHLLYVNLSCGCTVGFRCKPRVGDVLLCVRHTSSPVRVVSNAPKSPIQVP